MRGYVGEMKSEGGGGGEREGEGGEMRGEGGGRIRDGRG